MYTYIHAVQSYTQITQCMHVHMYIPAVQSHTPINAIYVHVHTCSPIPPEKFTYEYWLETSLERERDARERKQEVLSRGGKWDEFWSCEEGNVCMYVCMYVCVCVCAK